MTVSRIYISLIMNFGKSLKIQKNAWPPLSFWLMVEKLASVPLCSGRDSNDVQCVSEIVLFF
jgi:hypothetical protein